MAESSFDFDAFYRALDATRESRSMTWKQVAEDTAVSASTLARMARDSRPDAAGLVALSAWAGLNPVDFVRYSTRAPSGRAAKPEPLAEISRILNRDPNLDSDSAATLDDIVRAAYGRLARK